MFDFVCLWVGRIVVVSSAIMLFTAIGTSEIIRLPFRKPWQCIKHLLPQFWISEDIWEEFHRAKAIANADPNPNHYEEWKRAVILKQHGRLGIFIVPAPEYWWQPKHHLFIITKNKSK